MNGAIGVVELRQYTLKPGKRDALVELFERELIESQEETGMTLLGQFRDAGDPDRFVWLRGFADMERRKQALTSFYGGPAWKANREAANVTMIDSDNVLLLRPAWSGANFASSDARALRGATLPPPGFVVAHICAFDAPVSERFIAAFRERMPVRIKGADAKFLAAFVTEPSENTFPALPVREGENSLVWLALFADARSVKPIALPPELEHALAKPVETLRLTPTPRSNIHT